MIEAGKYEKDDLMRAVEVLQAGGVIVYPTDTVWGIGCDATNDNAVRRIYEIKHRADSKTMLVLLDSMAKLQGYVAEVPDLAWELNDLSEEPLTIIYDGAKNLAASLPAEDGSIGIRITHEPFSKALCERLHRPIVSTSANISGGPTARKFADISGQLLSCADYVVRYRQTDMSESAPSHIIKLTKGNVIKVIR